MTLTVLSLWLLLSVLCFVFKLTFIGGPEWGHLDKTKHFDVWFCNMKQLIFMHFNTNSKKFTLTVITVITQKLLCSVYKGVFNHFRHFPMRLPRILEDYRRFSRRNPKILDFIFVVIFTCERYIVLHTKP